MSGGRYLRVFGQRSSSPSSTSVEAYRWVVLGLMPSSPAISTMPRSSPSGPKQLSSDRPRSSERDSRGSLVSSGTGGGRPARRPELAAEQRGEQRELERAVRGSAHDRVDLGGGEDDRDRGSLCCRSWRDVRIFRHLSAGGVLNSPLTPGKLLARAIIMPHEPDHRHALHRSRLPVRLLREPRTSGAALALRRPARLAAGDDRPRRGSAALHRRRLHAHALDDRPAELLQALWHAVADAAAHPRHAPPRAPAARSSPRACSTRAARTRCCARCSSAGSRARCCSTRTPTSRRRSRASRDSTSPRVVAAIDDA